MVPEERGLNAVPVAQIAESMVHDPVQEWKATTTEYESYG